MKKRDLQITLKIYDGNMPKMLKVMVMLISGWAWVERMKCKLLQRTPCHININISTEIGGSDI